MLTGATMLREPVLSNRRPVWLASAAAAGLAAASLAAGVGSAFRRALPTDCPGVSELAVALMALLVPDAPIGAWLRVCDAAILVALAAGVAACSTRLGGRPTVGAAAGLTAATLAALHPQPLAATSALVLALLLPLAASHRRTAALSLVVVAALVAPGGLLLFLVAGALLLLDSQARAPRADWLVLASAAPLAAAVLAAARVEPSAWPGCLLPLAVADSRAALLPSLTGTFAPAGLYVITLALAGGAITIATPAFRTRGIAALVAFAGGSVLASVGPATNASPPLAVILSLLAALGARDLLDATHTRRLQRPAAVFFVGLMPLAALSALWQHPSTVSRDLGHDRLSRNALESLLTHAPAGAGLVTEDARVDLLMRAAALRGRVVPRVLPQAPAAVANARLRGPVIAMPFAQEWLKNRGFSLAALPDAAGLALVDTIGACRTLLGEWRRLSDLERADTFALVGEGTRDVGPITVYALFDARPDLFSLDWPAEAIPGFRWSRYGPGDRSVRPAIEADQVPALDLPLDGLFAIRLDLRRTATSPLALATTFHRAPLAVFGRLEPEAVGQRLSACPASTQDVTGFDRP